MKNDPAKYFDHNATAPICPEAIAAMQTAFATQGNASAAHDFGASARYLVESARESIAEALGVKARQLFFTSGGTESNNLAIHHIAQLRKPLAHGAIEHPAVGDPAQHWSKSFSAELIKLETNAKGRVVFGDLPDEASLLVMLANNESGILQDLEGARAATTGWLHCDAVQAVGKVPVDLGKLDVDSAALSAHKFYGPMGVGLLYLKNPEGASPFTRGGSQEEGIRPGTLNVAGIAGMAAALTATESKRESEATRLSALRDLLLNELEGHGLGFAVNGDQALALPNTVNLWIKGQKAGESVRRAADAGFAISAGAACASGAKVPKPSGVLTAMGLAADRALESVRITMGAKNTETSVRELAKALAG